MSDRPQTRQRHFKTYLVRDVVLVELLEHLQELARVAQQTFAGRLHVVEDLLTGIVGVGFFDGRDLRGAAVVGRSRFIDTTRLRQRRPLVRFRGDADAARRASKNTQATSRVNRTPPGGFLSAFTSSMWAFFSSLRHWTAAANAGKALSKSACASAAIAPARSEISVADASWTKTFSLTTAASFLSLSMTTCAARTPSRETRRRSCDHDDGVAASRRRGLIKTPSPRARVLSPTRCDDGPDAV